MLKYLKRVGIVVFVVFCFSCFSARTGLLLLMAGLLAFCSIKTSKKRIQLLCIMGGLICLSFCNAYLDVLIKMTTLTFLAFKKMQTDTETA